MSKIKIIPAFKPIFTDTKIFSFLWGGRGGGKSIAICDLLIGLSRQEKAAVLCTREVQKSIKESVYSTLQERIEDHGYATEYVFTKEEIRHKITGFRFIFAGLKDHTIASIKSYNVKYCWVEEAHSVSKKSLTILIPTLRKEGTRFFFSYNRTEERDPIHELCLAEFKDSQACNKKWKIGKSSYKWLEYNSPDAVGIYCNWDGNPYFPEILRKQKDKAYKDDYELYLHVWEGQPVPQLANSIISLYDCRQAVNREIEVVGECAIGCDVARFGDDRTVIYKRRGLKIIDTVILTKQDIPTIADTITVMADKEMRIRIDDTGLGGGVTDILKRKRYNVVPVIFGGTAKDQNKYVNTVSEMWFELAGQIGEISIPDDPELISELTNRAYEFDNKERKKVEPKANYKKRCGKSPDKADALIMCYYDLGGGKVTSTKSRRSTANYRNKKY